MKNKLTCLIIFFAIITAFAGCKKNCCVLPAEGNTIIALKNNSKWQADGYLYKYNLRNDTIYISGSTGQDGVSIRVKRSGNGYILLDASYSIFTGDMIWADYELDPSKNNSFATSTNTDEMLEGNFELYFKNNHPNAQPSYPATATFKSGLFSIRWDHKAPVGLP